MRQTRFSSVTAALALVIGGLAMVVVTAPAASADTYTPPPGARMNNPQGDWAAKNRIAQHIIRSIYSVPHRGVIRIASWNIRDQRITGALVNVHRHNGVSVQVIMQDDNAYAHEIDPKNPIPAPGDANPDWHWMARELRKPSSHPNPHPAGSAAYLCDASCRGGSGIAHTKMMLFSQVHTTPHVTMYGSGNLTTAAGGIQWNDLQTVTRNKPIYDFAFQRFVEMKRDVRMGNPYRSLRAGGVQLMFFPHYGAGATGDPIMKALSPVRCRGAARDYGTSTGRTIIRVAQTSIGDSRGKRVAWRLRELKGQGCSVKVLYGLMGPEVKRILRGGGVPIHQLATDVDGDLIYDRYLHQKVLTINGKYGSDSTTTLAFNGSANIQNYTMASDEILGRISASTSVRFYQGFVDRWFGRSARYARGADGSTSTAGKYATDTSSDNVDEERARRLGIDPYAKFQVN